MNEQNKVKILGISGSPRHANTELAVKEALKAAEDLGFVETDFLSLADYNLQPCKGEMKCFGWRAPADQKEWECTETKDDSKIINSRVKQCDGLILGTPIYVLDVTSLTRIFMEKAHCFGFFSFTQWAGELVYKPIGLVTVGGADIGGQEYTSLSLITWALALGMIPIGAVPFRMGDTNPVRSALGAFLSTVDAVNVYRRDAITPEQTRTKPPMMGVRNMRSVRNTGRNVAIATIIVKAGVEALEEKGIQYPKPSLCFKKYSVKPVPGSYVDKLIKEGKLELVSPVNPLEEG